MLQSKKVLSFAVLLSTFTLINVWYLYPAQSGHLRSEIRLTANGSLLTGQPEPDNESAFAVDTKRCRILLNDPLPISDLEYFKDYLQGSTSTCQEPFDKKPLFRTRLTPRRTCPTLDYNVLHNEYSAAESDLECVFQPVRRDHESRAPDRTYKIGNPSRFNWSKCPEALEIQISCNITNNNNRSSSAEYQQFLLMTSIADTPQLMLTQPRTAPFFNVMVLGIDSLSRLAFHRTMPNTLKQLRMLYGGHLVELLGFNKVGENSAPNQIPFLTGRKFMHSVDMLDHRYFDDWADYIWDEYRRKGYRTLFLEELPKWGLFTYPSRQGFKNVQTDYWPRSLMLAMEKLYPFNCYYNQTQSSVYLKYLEDTMYLLTRNRPLFAYAWFSLETHGNLAGGWGNDNDIAQHFDALHNSGVLNHTIVFLLADHGYRMGWFRKTRQGTLEDMLPFAFVLLPNEFVQLRPDALSILKTNSRRLVTPYDIHATLQDLADPLIPGIQLDSFGKQANSTSSNFGVSILSEVIPVTRTCRQAGILDQFCSCYRYVNESNSQLWPVLGQYVVDAVNKRLDDANTTAVNRTCAQFSLERPLQVERMFEGTTYLDKYKVRVSTTPEAIFEALVGSDQTSCEQQTEHIRSVPVSVPVESIVRVDEYDKHSKCAKNQSHERFCYCIADYNNSSISATSPLWNSTTNSSE